MDSIALHNLESTWLILEIPAISTISFYSGSAPIDFLKSKLHGIVVKNPWLEGILISSKSGINVEYPRETELTCFYEVWDDAFNEDLSYDELLKHIESQHTVKAGKYCLNKKEKLFKMVVYHINSNKFAILCSISHLIADGFTYYELYGMISLEQDVHAMVADRVIDYQKKVNAFLDGDDTFSFVLSIGAIINVVKTLLFSKKPQMSLVYIDQKAVEHQKTLNDPTLPLGTPFVSSNDVLTSWYFKFCDCSMGYMAINLRNRMSEIHANLAGNYEVLVGYQPQDFSSPNLIRRSLQSYRRVFGDIPFPSFPMSISYQGGLLSSWASFYKDVLLPGCDMTLHLPYVLNENIAFNDLAVLFRPQKDKLALLSLSRSYSGQQLLNSPLVEGPLTLPLPQACCTPSRDFKYHSIPLYHSPEAASCVESMWLPSILFYGVMCIAAAGIVHKIYLKL